MFGDMGTPWVETIPFSRHGISHPISFTTRHKTRVPFIPSAICNVARAPSPTGKTGKYLFNFSELLQTTWCISHMQMIFYCSFRIFKFHFTRYWKNLKSSVSIGIDPLCSYLIVWLRKSIFPYKTSISYLGGIVVHSSLHGIYKF